MRTRHITGLLLSAGLLSACSSNSNGDNIFSYSKDRCLGSYNQCRNNCVNIPSQAAQSSCFQRCYSSESQCYSTGDTGTGSSLAQESLIGHAKSESEKQAEFERWRAQRASERAESGESDVEIFVAE